jgi:methionine-R-sulfoxide reductase
MKRRVLIVAVAVFAVLAGALAVAQQLRAGPEPGSPRRADKVVLSDAEWRARLTPEQYRILRSKGTEAAFCSPMHDRKEPGDYHCAGCDLKLFVSDAKFISGTGWPSFFQPAGADVVWTKRDFSYGMIRMEVLCSRCDGHLGHVFEDGPRPTGLRYCINGEILNFKKRETEQKSDG